ncbi:MAG: Ig-like domain-containing protein, partial [Desulfobacterales bacterium]|nr:Ig-like domain-containing protein [Desulfobacterales bacterium]
HQTAESSVVTIPLEHLPNEVIFVSDASPQINPKEAKVGDAVTLKGKIVDANGDPVAGLTLSWTLVGGPGSSGHYLGASRVNSEGIAAINFGTSKTSGHYTIKMFIKEFPTLASSHALELVPGAPSQILISHIKPVRVAEDRVVRLRALDKAGNHVENASNHALQLFLEKGGLGFEFTDQVIPIQSPQGRKARVSLVQGQADVTLHAGHLSGLFAMGVAMDENSDLELRYDHDGNPQTGAKLISAIDLDVVCGVAKRIALTEWGKTNGEFGLPDVLEAGEEWQGLIQVFDQYDNIVDRDFRSDAGHFAPSQLYVTLNTTGSALLSSVQKTSSVTVNAGSASFAVTDQVVETITVSVVSISGGVDVTSNTLDLKFDKVKPHIVETGYRKAHNSLRPEFYFEYSEVVSFGSKPAQSVLFDGENTIEGTLSVADSEVRFVPTSAIPLSENLSAHSDVWELQGVDVGDSVLPQHLSIVGPQVALGCELVPFFLIEGMANDVSILFGNGINPHAIQNGIATIGEKSAGIDWVNRRFNVPLFNDLDVSDGESFEVAMSGVYLEAPLRAANTMTARILLKGKDFDQDGLSNEVEPLLGCDAWNSNTGNVVDDDGNPVYDGMKDYDGDLISNIDEINAGTDPTNSDTTPPEVVFVSPASGDTNIDVNITIHVRLSEEVKSETLSSNICLLQNNQPVGCAVNVFSNAKEARLIPKTELLYDTTYTVRVKTGVRDTAGNPMKEAFTSSFTTVPPDTISPEVASISPSNGDTQVSVTPIIQIDFTEPVQAASIGGESIVVQADGVVVEGAMTLNGAGTRLTWKTTHALPISTLCTVDVTDEVVDLFNNPMVPFHSEFTTSAYALIQPSSGEKVVEGQVITIKAGGDSEENTVVRLYANGLPIHEEKASISSVAYTVPNVFELQSDPYVDWVETVSTDNLSKGNPLWVIGSPDSKGTVIYRNDFESALGGEWSETKTETFEQVSRFWGRFNSTSGHTLSLIDIGASDYELSFDLYAFDSWDTGGSNGRDRLIIQAGGKEVFSEMLHSTLFPSTYPLQIIGSNSKWNDRIFDRITIPVGFFSGEIDLLFKDSGLQGIDDESWGIDNLCIRRAVYRYRLESGHVTWRFSDNSALNGEN